MKINKLKIWGAGFFAAIVCLAGAIQISAQDFKAVSDGTKIKIKGIIATRSPDSLTMRDVAGTDMYFVQLSPDTEVKTHRRGAFRGGKEYASSYLLRGLRIEVEGAGNADGHIMATLIRFDEDDLRTAEALQVTVDPMEANAKAKFAENDAKNAEQDMNAQRMSGQIDETQAAAARAQATADRANDRINGLDEFDPVKTIVVPFAVGSSTLGPKGKAIIDEAAVWTKTQNTKGWVVAVVGFADSTGNTAKNKALSERRSNAVIGYLVSKHNMPLTRLVQPFGAGVDQPVATNATAAGRAQNRRVEIRLLVNKGIAGK